MKKVFIDEKKSKLALLPGDSFILGYSLSYPEVLVKH